MNQELLKEGGRVDPKTLELSRRTPSSRVTTANQITLRADKSYLITQLKHFF